MNTDAIQQNEKKIRVLIVDDSQIIQRLLKRTLSIDENIEVVGTASDPYEAREKLIQLKPDVMTLDINMPKMDGLEFLSKVMQHFPIPTVIISNLVTTQPEIVDKAKSIGASAVLPKQNNLEHSMERLKMQLIEEVKRVAQWSPTVK